MTDSKKIEELAVDYDVAKSTLNIPQPYRGYPKGSSIQFFDNMLTAEKNKVVMFVVVEKQSGKYSGKTAGNPLKLCDNRM